MRDLGPRSATEEGAGPSSRAAASASRAPRTASIDAAATLGYRSNDVKAVVALADGIGRLEAQLAALKAPPGPNADAAPQMSEVELTQSIRRLQASREQATGKLKELGTQCDKARGGIEELNATQAGKEQRLEQLQREYDAATASEPTAPATQSRPSTEAIIADANVNHGRMKDISRQIESLSASREAAANEAKAVASRTALRQAGEVGAFEMMDDVSPALREQTAQWLRGETQVSRRAARPLRDQAFQTSLTTAFERISAHRGDPLEAVRAFMRAASGTGLENIGPEIERMLAYDLGLSLRVSNVGARQGKSLDQMNRVRSWVGQSPAQVTARRIREEIGRAATEMHGALRRDATVAEFGDQTLRGTEIGAVATRLSDLSTRLNQHQDAFAAMIGALEKHFIQSLEVKDPVAEKMGQQVAPHLDGYYGARISELVAERKALDRAPAEQPRTRATLAAPSTRRAGTDLEQLEGRIRRLQGEIPQYAAQHKSEFEHYASLSTRYLSAADELEAIDNELAELQNRHDDLRAARHEDHKQRGARGGEAERVEGELETRWNEAIHSPELHRVISPAALVRAIDVHFGKSAEQMRARLTRPGGTVSRTGTFSSRAALLRAIADIAAHEMSKPKSKSALLAGDLRAFERIASGYDSGRVDALCNHGRAIGIGVRKSASGIVEMRTNTSQYAIEWERGTGARISHLHPWVSPY
ncbi:hypothetical protein EPN42_16045 [bacterium]|nr:MAG: hypothetical protein EPN42_16045 [bacterium]